MKTVALVVCLLFVGCVCIPDNVKPVENFKLEKYLGKWYEIARLDHSFEKGLSRVTAEYSLRDDGGVRVVNRGYLADDDKWKKAEGMACGSNPNFVFLARIPTTRSHRMCRASFPEPARGMVDAWD
jgi:lipocalin